MANEREGAAAVPRRRPTSDQLRRELDRIGKQRGPSRILMVLLFVIVVLIVAAITFFILLSGYSVYGSSMSPTLEEGDLVLAIPGAEIQNGDMIAFRYEENILIKRVVASSGDTIEVLEDGQAVVNGESLYEPYARFSEDAANDMIYPLDVPEYSRFVLGDNRGSSVDSRSSLIGMIDDSRILGKIVIRIWPLTRFQVFEPNFLGDLFAPLKK